MKLQVHVVNVNTQSSADQDVYVKLRGKGHKSSHSTQVIKASQNIQFDESFTIETDIGVEISVCVKKTLKDTTLGKTTVFLGAMGLVNVGEERQMTVAFDDSEVTGTFGFTAQTPIPVDAPNEDDSRLSRTASQFLSSSKKGDSTPTVKKDVKKFSVRIIDGVDLMAADSNGLSDPYVKLSADGKSHKTKHISKTLNPVWNETFAVAMRPTADLFFEVRDHDTLGRDDALGKACILAADLQEITGRVDKELALEDGQGCIHVAIGPEGTDLSADGPSGASRASAASTVAKSSAPAAAAAATTAGAVASAAPAAAAATAAKAAAGPAGPIREEVLPNGEKVIVYPEVEWDLFGKRKFKVRMIGARQLIAADSNGKSDPYAKVKFGNSASKKTKTIKKTLEPSWNETFEGIIGLDGLTVSVFDWDRGITGTDDDLGIAYICLHDLADVEYNGKEVVKEFPLTGVASGVVKIGFTAVDTPPAKIERLHADISSPYVVLARLISGHNLIAADDDGLSDPYVKFTGKPGGSTYKSPVCNNTLNPVWNQTFELSFHDSVKVEAYDADKLGDDTLGHVLIQKHDLHTVFSTADPNKEFIKTFKLQGVASGELKMGFIFLQKPHEGEETGDVKESLREHFHQHYNIPDRLPMGIMIAACLLSFVAGWLGFSWSFLILIAAFFGYWVAQRDRKLSETRNATARILWRDHYKMHPEYETCEWMNKMMWQYWTEQKWYLDNYTREMCYTYGMMYKPAFLTGLEFTTATVGDVPFVMDCLKTTCRGDTMLFDFCLRWASNMEIQAVASTSVTNLPIVFKNFFMEGKMRMEVKFLPAPPGIRDISVTFLEMPKIDFVIKPLAGVNLMAIPGLEGYVTELINETVIRGMYLFPNKYVYSFMPQAPPPAAAAAPPPVAPAK